MPITDLSPEPSTRLNFSTDFVGFSPRELIGTDPALIQQPESSGIKQTQEQQKPVEKISHEKGAMAAEDTGATGSETCFRHKWIGFGAVVERSLRGLLRLSNRREGIQESKMIEMESERTEMESEEIGVGSNKSETKSEKLDEVPPAAAKFTPQATNEQRTEKKARKRRPRAQKERPEYAEFSLDYLRYIRREGFRY